MSAPADALWPLVSDTDRFNRDCGYPAVVRVPPPPGSAAPVITDIRRLRAVAHGVVFEWDEQAFEWEAPRKFSVERTYHRGPLARMVVTCELAARDGGGTTLEYDMRVTPANWLGRLALPFALGRKAGATMERVFRRYDAFAQQGLRTSVIARRPKLANGAGDRLREISRALIETHRQNPALVARLQSVIEQGDDLAVSRLRPYALADECQADRRTVLQLFLHATRAGLLDFSWDLVCPHCRGASRTGSSLGTVKADAHCESCGVDFTANFDQSVELTFRPNVAIRVVERPSYCVGGPQVTPHILAQQFIRPGAHRAFRIDAAPGRYRVRSPQAKAHCAFRVQPAGESGISIDLAHPLADERALAPAGELTIVNPGDQRRLVIVEHLAWTDQATTAAEVTALQLFRDLFSREVLRRGEQISVGSMTIVFTDLKNSTQLYQEIGDAPAFGRVLTHFEILKAAVAAEGGGIVKTMGDAIMAAFPRPIAAVKAMLQAQRWLADPAGAKLPDGSEVPPDHIQSLALKAGIHLGPCLAMSQNDRLDYFGTTVNATARLCSHSTGRDLVLSAVVQADPEVSSFLSGNSALESRPEEVRLRGFGETTFQIARVMSR